MKRIAASTIVVSVSTLLATVAIAPVAAVPPPRVGYIVQVVAGQESAAEAQATSLGGTIGFRYSHALHGFSVALPAQAATALAQAPGVVAVEPDLAVTIDTTQSGVTWGLDRIDQATLPLNGSYSYPSSAGAGVRAYIIDTGILASHSDFGGRVNAAIGYTAIADSYGTTDCNGHGTHVSGTVAGGTYGVAKAATLIPIRVLGCTGSGSTSGVVAGIDWMVKAKQANPSIPMVANMSLGGGFSSTLNAAVASAVSAGIVMAVAAGNSNADACASSPSSAASALTVGATDSSDARASYSNYGTCVDLFAPGSSIKSDWYTSTTATNTISGTSMATPHVTGAATLYLGLNPSATPATVAAAMLGSATAGVVGNPGTGSPNLLLYTGSLGPQNPVTQPPTAPTNVVATAGDGQATITWSAVSGADSYTVSEPVTSALCATFGTSCTITGLTNGTTYTFTLTAFNAAGASPEVQVSATPVAPPLTRVPSTPQGLAVTAASRSLTASWSAPSDPGDPAMTGYRVELWKGGSVTSGTLQKSVNVSALTYGFTNLSRNSKYYLKVYAVNSAGSSAPAVSGVYTVK